MASMGEAIHHQDSVTISKNDGTVAAAAAFLESREKQGKLDTSSARV
jgi:hypothetical protein